MTGKETYETHPVGPKPANKFIPCGTCIGEYNDTPHKIPCQFELLLADAAWLIRTQCNRVHILQGFFGIQPHELAHITPNEC